MSNYVYFCQRTKLSFYDIKKEDAGNGENVMIEYVIKKENHNVNNVGAYSIIVKNNGEVAEKISNAFLNKGYAEKIVLLCNRLQLSPAHIYEVVENAIYNFYC